MSSRLDESSIFTFAPGPRNVPNVTPNGRRNGAKSARNGSPEGSRKLSKKYHKKSVEIGCPRDPPNQPKSTTNYKKRCPKTEACVRRGPQGLPGAPRGTILEPRENLGIHFGSSDRPGGPWEQQGGHEVVWNRTFIDLGVIFGPIYISFLT